MSLKSIADIYDTIEGIKLGTKLLVDVTKDGDDVGCNVKLYLNENDLSKCSKIGKLDYEEIHFKSITGNHCSGLQYSIKKSACMNNYLHILLVINGSQCIKKHVDAIAYKCEKD